MFNKTSMKCAIRTLEEQALHSITKLMFDSAEYMVKIICIIDMVDPEIANEKLNSMIQSIKQFMTSIVSPQLMLKISKSCFMALDYDNNLKINKHFYNYDYVIVKMASAIFSSRNLQTLSCYDFPLIAQCAIFEHLPCMHELQVLNLDKHYMFDFPYFIELLINGLFNMPNLKEFTQYYFCTDDIIATIASNCKMIEKIDVMQSKYVTDACLLDLLSCVHLKYINFYETSFYSYHTLYMKLPCLKYIDEVYVPIILNNNKEVKNLGSMVEGYFVPAVEGYTYYNNVCIDKTTIKNLRERIEISQKQNTCPNITRLGIILGNLVRKEFGLAYEFDILTMFSDINDVLIAYYRLRYFNKFHNTFKLKGTTIRNLCFLKGVLNLELIIKINELCPNIESLSFYNCTFDRCKLNIQDVVNDLIDNIKVKPFQSLKTFEFYETNCVKEFEFLASVCTNIKSIVIDSLSSLNSCLEHILKNVNSMEQLEELVIVDGFLNESIFSLLIHYCDNLSYLPMELSDAIYFRSAKINLNRVLNYPAKKKYFKIRQTSEKDLELNSHLIISDETRKNAIINKIKTLLYHPIVNQEI